MPFNLNVQIAIRICLGLMFCIIVLSSCTTIPVEGQIYYREDGTIERKDFEDLYNQNLVLSTYYHSNGTIGERHLYNSYGQLLEVRHYRWDGTLN